MKASFFSGQRLNVVIRIMVVFAAIYHLSSVYLDFHSSFQYLNTHLFFALTIAGLASLKKWPKYWPLWLLFLAGSVMGTGYVEFNYRFLEMRSGYPLPLDMVIGVILIVLTIVGSWWAFGSAIPYMVIIFIAYALLGFLIPGYFHIRPPEFPRLISHLSVGLQGIYGTPLAASAHYIFIFIIFGGLIEVSKASEMFSELGKVISRGTRGGPAHACVITSTLIGMIGTSSSGNAAISGGITIPTMKHAGYKPEQAAAFEAAASQGSQIMPPVMGASAFVMAELTGVSYVDIAMKALVPGLLFILGLMVAIEIRARKLNLASAGGVVDFRRMFIGLPLFVIPFAILVVLFMAGHSANYAAFWATIGLLVTAYIRKETRLPLNTLIRGLEQGVIEGVQIALACASLGMVVSIMTTTGLAVKIPQFVEMLCMGNLWLAMVLTMIVSLILGGPLPTLPTYLMTVLVTAPVLVAMGVPLLPAHLAVLYFAIFEGVTPPFGSTAIVASGIAKADLMKTCWEGVVVCLPGLLLPFFWVINPTLMNIFLDPLRTLITLAGITAVSVSISVLFTNYYFIELKRWERVTSILSIIGLCIPLASGNYSLLPIGMLLFISLTAWQYWQNKKVKAEEQRIVLV